MPRDANGNYTLPAGNPVVAGTTIQTSWANPTMDDLGAEIQDSLSRSGKGAMTAPLAITGSGTATVRLSNDGVNKAVLNSDGNAANQIGLQINSVEAVTIANDNVRIGGALGVGITPEPVQNNFETIRIGGTGAVTSFSINRVTFSENAYRDATDSRWERIVDGESSALYLAGGEFIFETAVSGAPNSEINWSEKVRIDINGNVGIGTASPDARLEVQTSQNKVATFDAQESKGPYISFHRSGAGIGNFGTARNLFGAGWSETALAVNAIAGQGFHIGVNAGGTKHNFDTNGNVGIGVTPESWVSTLTSLQIGGVASLFGETSQAAGKSLTVGCNIYNDGALKYIVTDEASRYYQQNGRHVFDIAASGTADTNVTFDTAMLIDNNGYEIIGGGTSRSIGGVEAYAQVEALSPGRGVSMMRNSNDAGCCVLTFGKSRGTTRGSNTLVQNSDLLGTIYWAGADGTDVNTVSAELRVEAQGTPAANNIPSRMLFQTTDAGGTRSSVLLLNSGGGVTMPGLPTTNPGGSGNLWNDNGTVKIT